MWKLELGAEAIFRAWLTLASICLFIIFWRRRVSGCVVWAGPQRSLLFRGCGLIFIAGEEMGLRIARPGLGAVF